MPSISTYCLPRNYRLVDKSKSTLRNSVLASYCLNIFTVLGVITKFLIYIKLETKSIVPSGTMHTSRI